MATFIIVGAVEESLFRLFRGKRIIATKFRKGNIANI